MKKIILAAIGYQLLAVSFQGKAQIINPGFETWTADLVAPTANDPNTGNASTGWWDYNFLNNNILGASPISLLRVSDTVHSGTYAARLETTIYTPTSYNNYIKFFGIPFIGHIYSDTLGVLFTGTTNITAATFVPGIPMNKKITQFKFYYQYKPNGVDTAQCRVLLLKNVANVRTIVSGGIVKIPTATGNSGWQQAVVNIVPIDTLTPDTMYVLFSSSSLDSKPMPGSVLWIDDASVAPTTGINEVIGDNGGVIVYPNPCKGVATISITNYELQIANVEVYNVLGEKVYSNHQITKSSNFQINLSSQPGGVYFYRLMDNDGNMVKTGKLSVVK